MAQADAEFHYRIQDSGPGWFIGNSPRAVNPKLQKH